MRLPHALALAGLLVLAGCSTTSQSSSGSDKTVTLERPKGEDFVGFKNDFIDATTIKVGQTLTVRLPGNPHDTFRWSLKSGDTSMVAPAGDMIFIPDGSGLSDNGGLFVFKYEAKTAGTTVFNYEYRAGPGVLDARVKKFALTITVN